MSIYHCPFNLFKKILILNTNIRIKLKTKRKVLTDFFMQGKCMKRKIKSKLNKRKKIFPIKFKKALRKQ